ADRRAARPRASRFVRRGSLVLAIPFELADRAGTPYLLFEPLLDASSGGAVLLGLATCCFCVEPPWSRISVRRIDCRMVRAAGAFFPRQCQPGADTSRHNLSGGHIGVGRFACALRRG